MAQAEGVFGCQVKNLDYMIVNERKFRVKITLEFTGQLFCQREFQFFDGLKDESLETKRTQVSMTCLELTKKDEVTIDETFKGKDSSLRPEYILKQDFAITENYRQVTTEKVVINGFIFCSLLYCAQSEEEGSGSVICQHNQRIEFTQFVAIDKEQITTETRFEDLNADSLDVVEVIMALEQEFDLEIPDEEVEQIKNIGAVVEYIQANI